MSLECRKSSSIHYMAIAEPKRFGRPEDDTFPKNLIAQNRAGNLFSSRSLGHDCVDPRHCDSLQRRPVCTTASRFREDPTSASVAASWAAAAASGSAAAELPSALRGPWCFPPSSRRGEGSDLDRDNKLGASSKFLQFFGRSSPSFGRSVLQVRSPSPFSAVSMRILGNNGKFESTRRDLQGALRERL